MKNTTNIQVLALKKYFEECGDFTAKDEDQDKIDTCQKYFDDGDYMVLTDDEADEKAKEYILDSAWAFNYSFLCSHSEAIAEIPEKEFKEMQGKLCESFNKAVLAMIPDKDHFVKDAIACDGRGHFMSSYDGEENEVKIDGEWYFIYRLN